MKSYRLIVFDFDGTLVDTAPDILTCVNAVFAENGLPTCDLSEVRQAIGLGVRRLVHRLSLASSPSETNLDRLASAFKTRYAMNLVVESKPYPDVLKVLSGPLSSMKKAIVTNKPNCLLNQILNHFGFNLFFHHVIGTGSNFPAKPKADAVQFVMKDLGVNPKEVMLIGDSQVDMETARNAGVDFGWVSFGYEDQPPHGCGRVFSNAAEWTHLLNGQHGFI